MIVFLILAWLHSYEGIWFMIIMAGLLGAPFWILGTVLVVWKIIIPILRTMISTLIVTVCSPTVWSMGLTTGSMAVVVLLHGWWKWPLALCMDAAGLALFVYWYRLLNQYVLARQAERLEEELAERKEIDSILLQLDKKKGVPHGTNRRLGSGRTRPGGMSRPVRVLNGHALASGSR